VKQEQLYTMIDITKPAQQRKRRHFLPNRIQIRLMKSTMFEGHTQNCLR